MEVGDPAVEARGAAQRGLRESAAVDRHRRRRRRQHAHAAEVVEAPGVLDVGAAPELAHHLDHLVGALAAGVEVLPRQLELFFAPAHADAERDAITRERRRGRDRLGREERIAQREHVDVGDEAQPRGDGGHRADRDPRVGPRRVFRPADRTVGRVGIARGDVLGVRDVIGDRDGVDAVRFGESSHFAELRGRREGGRNHELHRSQGLRIIETPRRSRRRGIRRSRTKRGRSRARRPPPRLLPPCRAGRAGRSPGSSCALRRRSP